MLTETKYHNCNVNVALTKELVYRIANRLSDEEKPDIVLIGCSMKAKKNIAQFNGDEIRGIEVLLTYAGGNSSLPNKIFLYKRRQIEVSYNPPDYVMLGL
ncbi:hypothetical protein HYU07_04855 [Candidatus Woesearchaeota archaeon]|nr:hypothetical protein [Candidatus Woesearchaeota archaeon]